MSRRVIWHLGVQSSWTIAIHQSYHLRYSLQSRSRYSPCGATWDLRYMVLQEGNYRSRSPKCSTTCRHRKKINPWQLFKTHIFGLSEFMRARPKFTRLHLLHQMRLNTSLGKSTQIFKADTFNNRLERSEQYYRETHKSIQVSVSNNKFCTAISWSRSAPLMADWPWKIDAFGRRCHPWSFHSDDVLLGRA